MLNNLVFIHNGTIFVPMISYPIGIQLMNFYYLFIGFHMQYVKANH